jgi:multisite-specific tRNA:(cytosine-C5)-methyltransferase
VLENNSAQRLRIVSAGVKAFVRQDSQNRLEIPCKWRIPADGVSEILPHVGDGTVKDLDEKAMETLRILVEEPYPMCDHFPSPVKEWAEDAQLGNYLLRFPVGQGAGGR